MIGNTKSRLYRFLRWTERYTKTDMVYFASGNFWLLFGRVTSIVAGMGITVVLANSFSLEEFGTYKYILATAGILGAFTLNSVAGALIRAINQGKQNVIPSVYRTTLKWSVPAAILSCTVAGYYLYHGNSVLGWSLVIVGLTLPHQTALAITKVLFAAHGDFKNAAKYNTIRNLVQVGAIICALLLSTNVLTIVAIYMSFSVIIGYITYRQSLAKLKVVDDPTYHDEVIHYALHFSFMGAFQTVVAQIDQFLLWHFTGPVAVATYGIALGPAREIRTISDNINAMATPRIAQKNPDDARMAVSKKTKHLLFLYVAVTIVYVCAAPLLFKTLFPKYMAAVLPSQILAFGLLFQYRSLADIFLFSHGTVKDRYAITVPSQIIRTLLFVTLIPTFGLYGAVIGNVLSEVGTAATVAYAYKRHKK